MKKDKEDLLRKIEVLQERVSKLHTAVLRISASLDLDTVLQEVVDSARGLTGARYGVITTVDEAGRPREFVTSGLAPDEKQRLAEWSDGVLLFEHLRDLPGAVRVGDLPGYVRKLGFSTDLMMAKTLQGAPLRHRGMYLGSFFLAEKERGQEFTNEDEEVLVLFAAQAASAIANARTYRDEQRSRADLEALVDTSPVGVVVFDAKTGTPVLFNREAKRIVEGLRMPERPVEQLLEMLTCRRYDGSEVVLREAPLAQLWQSGVEMLRAEEIVLSVPDGRSVKMLVNVTPLHAECGEIESVVVTMQDLTSLEELERMQSRFLGMVSHELRTPLISIKGSTATVLSTSPPPDTTEMLQLFRVIDEQADSMRRLIGDLLEQGRIETGTLPVSLVPVAVAGLVEKARSTFSGGGGRHLVRIDLPEELPLVTADPQRIVQILVNLLSNAAKQSDESAPIEISATRDGAYVAISVAADGRGVTAAQLPHLFRKRTGVAGGDPEHGVVAGLGLVICKGLVEAHGGRIWAESDGVDRGIRFTFTVPEEARSDDRPGSDRSPFRSSPEGHQRTPILVLDNDPQMLRHVRNALVEGGYAPVTTGDPQMLPELVRTHQPRLVLLDLILSGIDGIELMESVAELAELPVIFISAYSREETIVRALDAGAADYIVKPFSPTELTARVRAVLRRLSVPETFVLGALSIHYEQRRVTVDGRPVTLTATEFEMLRALSMKAGQVLTYGALLRHAWAGRNQEPVNPQLVRAVAKRLRSKLGDDTANPAYVLNVRGVGYRMPGPGDL